MKKIFMSLFVFCAALGSEDPRLLLAKKPNVQEQQALSQEGKNIQKQGAVLLKEERVLEPNVQQQQALSQEEQSLQEQGLQERGFGEDSDVFQLGRQNCLIPESLSLSAKNAQHFLEWENRFLHPELYAAQDQSFFIGSRAKTPPYTGLLDGFGRGIVIPSNPSLVTPNDNTFIVVCGYAYEVNPSASGGNAAFQATQTSYAMAGVARFNYTANGGAGGIDPYFGPSKNGQVLTIFKSSAYPLRVVIQPAATVADQKIIVVGHTYNLIADPLATNNSNRYQLFVIRYNWDGSLDATFNPKGERPGIALLSLTDFSASAASAGIDSSSAILSNSYSKYLPSQGYALVLDAQNNIIVVGNANGMLLVARYLGSSNPSAGTYAGTLDTTFNPQGYLYDLSKAYDSASVSSQVVAQTQNNGGVIIDSSTRQPLKGTPGTLLCSILGSPTFANQGLVVVGNDGGYAVDLDPNGNIVVAGLGYQAVPGLYTGATRALLLRITPTGTFDTTFGKLKNGIVITSVFDVDTRAYSVVINKIIGNSDYGKITIAGVLRDSFWNLYAMVARYLPSSGLPDATFGPGTINNGKDTKRIPGISFFAVQTFSSQANTPPDIFTSSNASITNPYSAYYNSTTTPTGLNMTTDIAYPSVYTMATALRLQDDGKVILSGYTLMAPGVTLVGLQQAFTPKGFPIPFAVTKINFTSTYPITSMMAARLTTKGLLDTTFNPSQITSTTAGTARPARTQPGVTVVPLRGKDSYDDQAYDLAIQATDQKIIIMGQSKNNSFDYASDGAAQLYAFAAARLTKNGLLDTTLTAIITNQ